MKRAEIEKELSHYAAPWSEWDEYGWGQDTYALEDLVLDWLAYNSDELMEMQG
jgi:hypothetical protein